jgi:HEPN domain-containing protein
MNKPPVESRDEPIRKQQPDELWSVWEMLKFYAKEFIELGQVLGLIQMAMEPDPSPPRSAAVSDVEYADALAVVIASEEASKNQLRDDLRDLAKVCAALEMEVSAALVESRIDNPPRTNREFMMLSDAVEFELKSKRLLYVPKDRVRYFENDRIISDPAKSNFETAYAELREAGTSFALARYTGSVLHCMRAAEVGVKALARALGFSPPDLDQQDWHPILNKCESLIGEIRDKGKKGPEKEETLRMYSQAAAQFRHFKDGWRVQAAHARPPFSEAEARAILDATISFFETLAPHLSERAAEQSA